MITIVFSSGIETNDAEHKELLLQRIEKLRLFAGYFGDKPNHPLIMLSLYLILQTDCKPRVALYRYARYLFVEWFAFKRNAIKFWSRHYWLRYCRRMSDEEIMALYDREIEADMGFLINKQN